MDLHVLLQNRGGLVVRSRLLGRTVAGSKPDPTEDPLLQAESVLVGQKSSPCCGADAWRGRLRIRCRPRHLTGFQNYDYHFPQNKKRVPFFLFKTHTGPAYPKECKAFSRSVGKYKRNTKIAI
ncbi:hypothetical protein AVEN_233839-1 [Araneus ventricosus]|uniref:Uncharacterized protein n=1 Tax=Araneus ventricosus TaxID=182803 RepID=A0A4Y2H711_ARAVE|nr:hypothetical protein AVEN_233839-1 [Araneus ventricosus]